MARSAIIPTRKAFGFRRCALQFWDAWANGRFTQANKVFTPPAKEVARAEAILAALEDAHAKGLGATALDGVLIDAASIRQAQIIVGQMQMIRERESS